MRRLTLPGAILLSIVALYLLLAGVQQFIVMSRYPTPVSISYEEFEQLHPSAGWFKITNATVWFSEYRGPIGPARLSILPLRGYTGPTSPVEVFLEPKNPSILSTMAALDALPPGEPRAAYLRAHPDKASISAVVDGGLMASLDPAIVNLKLATAAYGNVDKAHVVILTEDNGPNNTSGCILVVGAFILVFMTYRWYAWSADPYRDDRIRRVMENPAEDPDRMPITDAERDERIRRVLASSGVDPDRKVDVPWWERPTEGGPPIKKPEEK